MIVGDPPRALLLAQRNDKYPLRLLLVTRRIWAEVAVWATTKSGLKRTGLSWHKDGLRLVTNYWSMALAFHVGRS